MLRRRKKNKGFLDDYVNKNLIPEDHELLKIDKEIDFSFIVEETRELYNGKEGRPSWPPDILFKMLFLEYYAKLSDVEVCKQCSYNLLYRRFVGLGITEKTPDDSTLVNFRKRLGEEKFESIFNRVLGEIKEKGLIGKRRYIDATHVIANVAIPCTLDLLLQGRKKIVKEIKSRYPRIGENLSKKYCKKAREGSGSEVLAGEVELTRDLIEESKGKYGEEVDKVIGDIEEKIYGKEKIVSLNDPDARWGYKKEDQPFCGYKVHVICDENEVISGVSVLSGNENEAKEEHVKELLDKDQENVGQCREVVADALYDSKDVREAIHELKDENGDRVKAYIPLRAKDRRIRRFKYDNKRDELICPWQKRSIGKISQENGSLYYFSAEDCWRCKYSKRYCGPLNENRARVYLSDDVKLWLMDKDERTKDAIKSRSLIERRFGVAKKWHGLSRARYWGKSKLMIQALMTFLVMNVKRMLKLLDLKELKLSNKPKLKIALA